MSKHSRIATLICVIYILGGFATGTYVAKRNANEYGNRALGGSAGLMWPAYWLWRGFDAVIDPEVLPCAKSLCK